jgi:hypothetical protein
VKCNQVFPGIVLLTIPCLIGITSAESESLQTVLFSLYFLILHLIFFISNCDVFFLSALCLSRSMIYFSPNVSNLVRERFFESKQ